MKVQQPWSAVTAKLAGLAKAVCAATMVAVSGMDAYGYEGLQPPSLVWVENDEPFGSPLFEGPPSNHLPLEWESYDDDQPVFASSLMFMQEEPRTEARPSEVVLVSSKQEVPPPPFEPPSPSDGVPTDGAPSDAASPPTTPPAGADAPAQQNTTYGQNPEPETRRATRWFLRTQSPLLRPGQFQFDMGIAYTEFQYDFPTIDLPNNVARADLRRRTIVSPFAIRYGVTQNLQAFANIPVGYRNTELGTAPVSTPIPFDASNAYGGVGDILVGTNYRLVRGDYSVPDIIWTVTGGLPTGEKSVLTDVFQGGLGTGFASLGTSFLVIHSYDPVVVFWGGGWQYYFQGELQGTPVQLGNVALYQLGTGFAVNDRVTLSTAFLGGYVQQTRINGINLPDSQQEPMRMRFAVTAFRNRHIVEPFSEIGMTFTSPNARVGVVWTF